MKRLFKSILALMVLLTAGLFSLEFYRSTPCDKTTHTRVTKNRSVQASPFYNTSDARAPYAFPLTKAQRQNR